MLFLGLEGVQLGAGAVVSPADICSDLRPPAGCKASRWGRRVGSLGRPVTGARRAPRPPRWGGTAHRWVREGHLTWASRLMGRAGWCGKSADLLCYLGRIFLPL